MMAFDDSHKRFVKFALVGISGTIVDFGFFNLFSVLFRLPVVLSSVLSFSIAVFNNFYWNRVWTYPESKQLRAIDQFVKFGVVSLFGLAIRTPLFALIKEPITIMTQTLLPANFPIRTNIVGHNFALALVIIVVLFWNYFANRFWTYRSLSFAKKTKEENES